jgi:hypothetical protein
VPKLQVIFIYLSGYDEVVLSCSTEAVIAWLNTGDAALLPLDHLCPTALIDHLNLSSVQHLGLPH